MVLLVWVALSFSAVWLITRPNRTVHATVDMGAGLIILWIGLCGGLMYCFRDRIRNLVLQIPLDWRVKFVLFSSILVLIEEAITTTMTNLAVLFGSKIGETYITASTNYLDVIFFHSVFPVIFPMFIAWGLLLWRYKFSPFQVFLLFGMTGIIAEGSFGGAWGAFAMFFFIYGLMIYLPAYCIPQDRPSRTPRWWLFPLAVFIPFIFIPLTNWIPKLIDPHHPQPTHFLPPNIK